MLPLSTSIFLYIITNKNPQDNIVLRISGSGLTEGSGEVQQDNKILYVLHPNCNIDDM
jgi:hypothetical protein